MKLRYFFDPGSGTCLWAADDEARVAYGYPVALKELNLTSDTHALGELLIELFDKNLNWADPSGASAWTDEERVEFVRQSVRFYERVVSELGPSCEVVHEVQA